MNDFVNDRERTPKWSLEVVVLIGMAAGAVFYLCISLGIETFLVERWLPPVGPRLSNGQTWFLAISLSAVLGASFAAASYLERGKAPKWLVGSVVAMPILVLLATAVFWAMDASRNGFDPSHFSLYAPVLVASLICAALNPLLLSIRTHRLLNR